MRILFDNKAKSKNATIVSRGSTVIYSPRNLVDDILEKRYQATGHQDVIDISFATPIRANCFFYGYHNLSKIEFAIYNTTGAELYSDKFELPGMNGAAFFPIVHDIGQLRVRITARSGAQGAYLGGVATGEAYRMPDPVNTWPIGYNDNSSFQSTPTGHTLSNYTRPLRRQEFEFQWIPLAQAQEILELYYGVGIGSPIWADAFEDSDIMNAIYCKFTEPVTAQKIDDRFSMTVKLEESR